MSELVYPTRAHKHERSPKKPEVSVIIPAFNESFIIGDRITEIKKVLKKSKIDHEILVVDDGSSDLTGLIAEQFGAKVLYHGKNCGKGCAIKTGVSYSEGDILVVIDPDGYSPYDIEKMVKQIRNGAELVTASRTRKGAIVKPYAMANRSTFATLFFDLFVYFITGKLVTDSLTSFRAFKKSSFNKLNISSNGFEIAPEITIKALQKDLDYEEISSTFNIRKRSKYDGYSFRDAIHLMKSMLLLLLNRGI